ncbi:hypothetical protein A5N15_09980 [Rothia kristinae]|uniref:Homoserine dehydrogenase n=1 Tax=Rothia kristinae TaxID=37923 RepID=A0A657IVS6_9MICC|nr:hypothetical protein A5N15_09980 [Rothia kristinae]
MNDTPLSVALLGSGTVGSQVARILLEDAEELTQRVGAPLRLIGIAVRGIRSAPGTTPPRPGCTRPTRTR